MLGDVLVQEETGRESRPVHGSVEVPPWNVIAVRPLAAWTPEAVDFLNAMRRSVVAFPIVVNLLGHGAIVPLTAICRGARMPIMDYIVFDKLETDKLGWKFEAHLELEHCDGNGVETDAFRKAFAVPFRLPILRSHDAAQPIGVIHGDGTGKVEGVVDAVLVTRKMEIGLGYKLLQWKDHDLRLVGSQPGRGLVGKFRTLEEIQLLEVSLFNGSTPSLRSEMKVPS